MSEALSFEETIRRQRMTRRFLDKPVPSEVLHVVLAAARKAPSAGFAQGPAFVVLQGEETEVFWRHTAPPELVAAAGDSLPPVLLLPLADAEAYVARYREPDKAHLGLATAEDWPVPYWIVDTAFASMAILLAATAHGLGCWFFGIHMGEAELLAELGVPEGRRPIGAIALGYPDVAPRSPSLARARKAWDDTFHFGKW